MMEIDKLFNVFAEYAATRFQVTEWDLFLRRARLPRLHSSQAFQDIRNLPIESSEDVGLSYAFIARHFSDLGGTERKRLETLETAAPGLTEWALYEVKGPNRDDFCDFLVNNWDLLPSEWQEAALESDDSARFPSGAITATQTHTVTYSTPRSQNPSSLLAPSVTASAPNPKLSASPPLIPNTPTDELKEEEKVVPEVLEKNIKPIFIIHGHDDKRKDEISRVLHNITSIKPIILHQQASNGDTIVEKLVRVSKSAGYAVALLTADDVGRSIKAASPSDEKPRGRQNVVFEAGFFTSLLGRKKVAFLKDKGVENIGDLDGVVYISFDSADWRHSLATELKNAGYEIDWESLTH